MWPLSVFVSDRLVILALLCWLKMLFSTKTRTYRLDSVLCAFRTITLMQEQPILQHILLCQTRGLATVTDPIVTPGTDLSTFVH
jgi:hypothetical protein